LGEQDGNAVILRNGGERGAGNEGLGLKVRERPEKAGQEILKGTRAHLGPSCIDVALLEARRAKVLADLRIPKRQHLRNLSRGCEEARRVDGWGELVEFGREAAKAGVQRVVDQNSRACSPQSRIVNLKSKNHTARYAPRSSSGAKLLPSLRTNPVSVTSSQIARTNLPPWWQHPSQARASAPP
jgi:hypothetical protein